MIRLLDRIRMAVAARETGAAVALAVAESEEPDSIRYAFAQPDQDARPRSLIVLLGEVPANAGEVLESVAAACRADGEFPVAVMSELRPGLIATASLPIEFLPAHRYLPVAVGSYERHLRRRWSLMSAKWEFTKHIEVGLGFEEFLKQQLSAAAGGSAAAVTPVPAER